MSEEPIAGRYELIEEIESGGMGAVWRGYDAVLDRQVAVKLIRPDKIDSLEQAEIFAKRFQREARVTARIRHHGVPQVYDAVLDRSYDRVYLVMELVQGFSLRSFINPSTPLPVTWAAAMAAQISTVLSHAHAVPVVHRDLKPDNLLVTGEGAVKVLDFGIAAIVGKNVTRLTKVGETLGTSQYMAPEQVRNIKVTPRSDLYALGCILHELLCGHPLFDGGTDFELWQQHASAPPRPLRELRADVPLELERLVLDLLKKNPEKRPRDAYAVYERLLPFLPVPGSQPPPADGRSLGVPDPTMMYRRPNAPFRGDTSSVVPTSAPADTDQPAVAPETGLHDAIKAAIKHSRALLNEERYAQAAHVLREVITRAADALGAESPQLLTLRKRWAAVLVLGGRFGQALPEFDALTAAYVRTAGPASPDALQCRHQAANCRAELGQSTVALKEFREVLDRIRTAEGDASDTALELRRSIGVLLLAEGDTDAASEILEPLYADLCLVYGPEHEDTQEVVDILAHLRLDED
ncbi:protein kinase [Nocardiopsis mangrovi]|uniref:non-specific serine/threonine protein kinase n=1 Tax=Nocardiopsis mangrovi TaxID=1179818 RepID=A0ABV9DVV8_9ACTN